MEYPRRIVLEDTKLKRLLSEKEELILQGRAKSDEIIALEADMDLVDKEIQEVEKKVDVSAIKAEADAVTVEVNTVMEKMNAVQRKLYDALKAAVPPSYGEKYNELKTKKEKEENDRNKIALKVQQKLDKIIPLGRELMKSYLENEFEDYDTLRLENGEVVATIFSHLDDFEKRYRKNVKEAKYKR